MRLRMDRRAFVEGSVRLGTLALVGCRVTMHDGAGLKDSAAVASPSVRRSLTSSAAEDDVELYKKAVALLKASGVWQAQATLHSNFCTHGNWFFLPWHRFYLMYFEEVCRHALRQAGESDTFSLPYWNWPDTGRKIPGIFWGDGNPLFNSSRSMGPNDTYADAACGDGTLDSIRLINNFLDFGGGRAGAQQEWGGSGQLEGTPHNTIHAATGGDMGALASPLDPIFWLHHANVDRLWATWQASNPHMIPSYPNAQDSTAQSRQGMLLDGNFWLNFALDGFEDINGKRFTKKVKDCLDPARMAKPYIYDTLVPKNDHREGSPAPDGTHEPYSLLGNVAPKPSLGLSGSGTAKGVLRDLVYVELKDQGLVIKVDQTNKIISANINLSPAIRHYITRLSDKPSYTGSLTLLVEKIPIPTDDLVHRIALDFYANHPNLTTETDASDPQFLSSYSFFAHTHPGAPRTVSIRIALNQPFLRMRAAKVEPQKALLLQILVKDRLLQTLPNLDFFSSVHFRLCYIET